MDELCFLLGSSSVKKYKYFIEQNDRLDYLYELYENRYERSQECKQFTEFVLKSLEMEDVLILYNDGWFMDAFEQLYWNVKNELEDNNYWEKKVEGLEGL